MKGYISCALGALLAWPLLENHPALFVVAMNLVAVVIVLFWTGCIRVGNSG